MRHIRLIPRLDIKGPNLIKGVHLEGLRVVGDPHGYAVRYYEQGADELLFMDAVASLYGRNQLSHIIERAVQHVFVPITVGGGIRSLDDARQVLRAGADKIAINTAAIARPELVSELAQHLGAQCVVVSIEAKEQSPGHWEAYTDNGRERSGRDVVAWAQQAVALGAGELLITSVDREGTRRGFDVALLAAVAAAVNVPVIASGGMGQPAHALAAAQAGVDAVAAADLLHYQRCSVADIKQALSSGGMAVRKV